jgi:phenylpyruvate tautomerase PptA (4-oxalocrotonate tautomerase family)
MPIVDITLIGEARLAETASAELAQAIAQVLGAAEGSVWVTLTRRPAADYAENGPPPEPPPVFVRVLARGNDRSARAAQAQAIAGAVAAKLSRPIERVHVILEPDAAGRVYFGGRPSQG